MSPGVVDKHDYLRELGSTTGGEKKENESVSKRNRHRRRTIKVL